MWHVLRLPMVFFSQRLAGDIALRQESNEIISETLIGKIAPMLLNAVMIIIYLTVLLSYSVLLTVIGLATILINILLTIYISNKRMNIARVQMRDSGKLAAATVSGIEMIETIKASGAENGFFERWAGFQANTISAMVRHMNLSAYIGGIPTFVSSLSAVIILISGTYLIMQAAPISRNLK